VRIAPSVRDASDFDAIGTEDGIDTEDRRHLVPGDCTDPRRRGHPYMAAISAA
jgi:hypothetical protein